MANDETVDQDDGAAPPSWISRFLRGGLLGAVLSALGVLSLSLSSPLPDHLPGVGRVEILGAPKPSDTALADSTGGGNDAQAGGQTGTVTITRQSQEAAVSADARSDQADTEQPGATGPVAETATGIDAGQDEPAQADAGQGEAEPSVAARAPDQAGSSDADQPESGQGDTEQGDTEQGDAEQGEAEPAEPEPSAVVTSEPSASGAQESETTGIELVASNPPKALQRAAQDAANAGVQEQADAGATTSTISELGADDGQSGAQPGQAATPEASEQSEGEALAGEGAQATGVETGPQPLGLAKDGQSTATPTDADTDAGASAVTDQTADLVDGQETTQAGTSSGTDDVQADADGATAQAGTETGQVTEQAADQTAEQTDAQNAGQSDEQTDGQAADQTDGQSDKQTAEGTAEQTGESTEMVIAALSPNADVPEGQDDDPVPTISLGGAALEVNARAFEPVEGAPLLSVVLEDAGNGQISADMLPVLTMPLTLAIRPGDPGSRALAEAARAAGHEVLVQLPMSVGEEAGLPGALDPGTAPEALQVQTTRYMALLDLAVGATVPDGARGVSDSAVLEPVIGTIGQNGFAFVEMRAGIGSTARRVASATGVPYAGANRYVPAEATEEQIYQSLENAAFQARRRGDSIVFISASQNALRALIRWGLVRDRRPVWYAPVSAVVNQRREP